MVNRRSFIAALVGLGGAVKAVLGFGPRVDLPAAVPTIGSPEAARPKTLFVEVRCYPALLGPVQAVWVLNAISKQFPDMTILPNEFSNFHSSFWPIFTHAGDPARFNGVLLYRDSPEDMYGGEPAEQVWTLDSSGFHRRDRHTDTNGENWTPQTDPVNLRRRRIFRSAAVNSH